jgi:dihydropteroate synthase
MVDLGRPIVVGIVNVTPDSFSDGGSFFSVDDAVARAVELVADGADILDIGGESTRPQRAVEVPVAEELRRVLPVIEGVRSALPDAVISVDTVKAEVARQALASGAAIVNDVSGFRLDPEMAGVCAELGAGAILMHSRGGVATMGTYADAQYSDDVVGDVARELGASAAAARQAGIEPDAIVLDPGIGFAKRSEHSLALLGGLQRILELGYPVLVGVSRKRFIGEITGVAKAADRDAGTTGANVAALLAGARLFRVHEVKPARHALDVAWAIHTAAGAR